MHYALGVYKTLRAIDFLHRPAVKFSRFRFRGTEPKTLLYVGHRSQGELWRCEDTQFFGNQSLHGANFLFQTTDYPDIFLSTDHIKNSWLSVQFVGNNNAHKLTLSKLISRPQRTRIITNKTVKSCVFALNIFFLSTDETELKLFFSHGVFSL